MTTATGNSESSLMFVRICDDVFVGTDETAARMMSERGSAMQAQTKSQEICTSMSSRSVIER